MKHERTFSLTKLYHQFLKPRFITVEALPKLIVSLENAGFIVTKPGEQVGEGNVVSRYAETEKLTSGLHKDELFSIVCRLSGD